MARGVVLRKATRTQVGDLVDIDACLDESHDLPNTVTDHPVEEGFNTTDHVRPEPDRVTLRCFVSNTPFSEEQMASAARAGSWDFQTLAPETVPGRGDNAFAKLKKMRDDGAIITVVTTLRTYGAKEGEGMVIERLSVPRTLENYDGLEFTLQLKQVHVVRNRSTRAPKAKDTRARAKEKKGHETTKGEDNQTHLDKLLHAGGVFK